MLCLLLCMQTQVYVKVYNLAKQELTRKLHSGVKWISSIDIHPHGRALLYIVGINVHALLCDGKCCYMYTVVLQETI